MLSSYGRRIALSAAAYASLSLASCENATVDASTRPRTPVDVSTPLEPADQSSGQVADQPKATPPTPPSPSAPTHPAAPDAPATVAVNEGLSGLTLTWQAVPGSVSYLVVHSQTQSPWTPANGEVYALGTTHDGWTTVYDGSATSFIHTTPSIGLNNHYRVFAHHEARSYSPASTAHFRIPAFQLSRRSVLEGISSGAVVGSLTKSAFLDGTMSFSLVDDDNGRFTVAGDQIVTAAVLQRSEGDVRTLTVVGQLVGGASFTESFEIRIDSPVTFTNVTTTSGFDCTYNGAWGDYDNDGKPDWYSTAWTNTGKLLRNGGDGTFLNVAASAGASANSSGQGVAWSDFNGDGWLDVFVGSESGTSQLYRNNGDGTFTNVATVAGVGTRAIAAAFADTSGDGFPELFVGRGIAGAFFRNNGDGTFSDATTASNLSGLDRVEGISWGDFNGDGKLDLFVCRNGTKSNKVFMNAGDGTFVDKTTGSGIGNNDGCRGSAIADYDGDGDADLFLSSGHLYRNDGDFTFVETTSTTGAINTNAHRHGAAWADYDQDGYMDLYATNWGSAPSKNLFYKNLGGTQFADLTEFLGLGRPGTASPSFGDFDGDGDEDLAVCQGGVLQSNNLNPQSSTWLAVDVRGSGGSRGQGGIAVALYDGVLRLTTKYLDGGSGYGSQNALPVIFGGLQAHKSYHLTVTYTDGMTKSYATGTPNGQTVKIVRGVTDEL